MKAQLLSRKVCYSFQAKIYAILACALEIQTNARPEKYVSICSESGGSESPSGCQNIPIDVAVPKSIE